MAIQMIDTQFKDSKNGNTITIPLNMDLPIQSLRNSINDKINSDLAINESFKIVTIGQKLKEFGSNIDETSELSIKSLLASGPYAFYITTDSYYNSVQQTNCSVCFENFISFQNNFTCNHDKSICRDCIHNWQYTCSLAGRICSCPICRTEI